MSTTAKLSSMGILFLVSILSSIVIPFVLVNILAKKVLQSSDTFKKVIGALNCFSAGVFISTSFLILLPEAREMVEEAMTSLDNDTEFPLTEVLVGLGLLLILFIQTVVEIYYHRFSRRKTVSTLDTSSVHAQGDTNNETVESSANPNKAVESSANSTSSTSQKGCSHLSTTNSGQALNVVQITIYIALSIHMLFDGLGVGLVRDSNKVWSILLAVTIHKVLIFFSLGLHTIESETLIRFIGYMVFISIVSPVGIGIGMLLSSNPDDVSLVTVSGILQSISAGTFLHVSLFEILQKEMSLTESKLFKVSFVILGYGVFAGIVYVNP